MRNILIASAMTLLLGACAGGSHDSPVYQLDTDVASARIETSLHRQNSDKAANMAAMMNELGRHEDRMADISGSMHRAIDDGSWCDGMMSMTSMMDVMDDEMRRHSTLIEAADTIDAARTETERHTTEMFDMLDTMDDDLGHMSCMGMGMGMHR